MPSGPPSYVVTMVLPRAYRMYSKDGARLSLLTITSSYIEKIDVGPGKGPGDNTVCSQHHIISLFIPSIH